MNHWQLRSRRRLSYAYIGILGDRHEGPHLLPHGTPIVYTREQALDLIEDLRQETDLIWPV